MTNLRSDKIVSRQFFGSGVSKQSLLENRVEFKIELESGTVPKRSKLRLLNPFQERNLKDQIDEWI